MQITLELVDELFTELQNTARACGLKPRAFAEEALQSVLASRRLPRMLRPPSDPEPEIQELDKGDL